ncbi:ankyrin repeat-containing domain protein [Schizophyllum commune]
MGANLKSRDVDGCTALHYATRGAYLGTVSILLERGADVNAREKTGKTALHLAATGVILRSAVEDPALDRSDLRDPCARPNIEVARALIDSGAHVDSKDDDGNYPLHLAAFYEEEGIVRLLIAAGVSPTSPNRIGRIPEDGIGTNSQLSASPAKRERIRQLLRAGMTVAGDPE